MSALVYIVAPACIIEWNFAVEVVDEYAVPDAVGNYSVVSMLSGITVGRLSLKM